MENKKCLKCGKELPDNNQKGKLCEEHNEKRKSIIKKILIGAGAVGAASIAAVLAVVASINNQDRNDIIGGYDDDYDYDNEDIDSEKISVWDAADIYLSSGFDEDYSFGYSHEELTDALKG